MVHRSTQGDEYRDIDWKLSCNTPAHRLYQSIGFEKIGICHWYAENVWNTDFYLFEYIL